MSVCFWTAAHHELQQLLLGALVQVGLFDGHQLASRDVACHVHLAQVIEAPPCDTENLFLTVILKDLGGKSGAISTLCKRLDRREGLTQCLGALTQLGQQLVVGWLG